MADLPSTATNLVTGGVIGIVLAGCGWLIFWFRSAAKDGADLADDRIAFLMADFKEYRERAAREKAITDAEVQSLRDELDDYREELMETRTQLRACRRDSHEMRMQMDELRLQVERLTVVNPNTTTTTTTATTATTTTAPSEVEDR